MEGTPPLIGLVSPCRNRRAKTVRFLDALRQQTWSNFRVYLVDSNSSDGTPEYVRRFCPGVTVLHADDSKFWTGATNIGVRQALADGCDYVLTINDDSVIPNDFLAVMADEAATRNLDVLSALIEYQHSPGLIWAIGAGNDWAIGDLFQLRHCDQWIDDLELLRHHQPTFRVEAMCGNGVLIHRRVFDRIGLYDEKWTPHYHADTEFVLRAASAGFGLWLTTKTVLYNDAFNDSGAPAAPALARPPVGPGDTGSLIRRLKADWKDLFLAIRSVYYWRAWVIVIWRFCPRALKVQCARAAISRIYRLFFRDSFLIWRGSAPKPAAQPELPLYPRGMRPTGPQTRGELSPEVWDDLSALPDGEFTAEAYRRVLGRSMEPQSSMGRLASLPRGRERVLRIMLESPEGDYIGLSHRVSPLVLKLLAEPDAAAFAPASKGHGHPLLLAEDVDDLEEMDAGDRVTAAYHKLLHRHPDAAAIPVQMKASAQSAELLLTGIVVSEEFYRRAGQVSGLVRKRLRLPPGPPARELAPEAEPGGSPESRTRPAAFDGFRSAPRAGSLHPVPVVSLLNPLAQPDRRLPAKRSQTRGIQ